MPVKKGIRTVFDNTNEVFAEKSTPIITFQLVDENGAGIPASALNSFELTYFNEKTNAVINNRLEQNVLNANNVTVDSSGNVTWVMQEADTVIVDTGAVGVGVKESHIASFSWEYDGTVSDMRGRHEVQMYIINMGLVS